MRKRLSVTELEETLPGLVGWELRGDRIAKTYRFRDFVTAFGFMTRVALVAEKRDHHPEWRNVYGTVEVELTTHDEAGITWLDVALARTMDELAGG